MMYEELMYNWRLAQQDHLGRDTLLSDYERL